MPSLTTVIVSYNTREETLACLTSLHEAPPSVTHDVIVVDNASDDGSPEAIRRAFPDVRVLDAGANLGFGAANNIGIRAAGGALCLLLNSDTLVRPGAIDTLVACLSARHDLAAAGPRLIDAEGRPEISFGRMIAPWNELRQKLIRRAYARGWRPAVAWVERATRREACHDWVSGACLLVRREAALQCGLFDERFFLYTEDVDLCAALRGHGGRIGFCPAAEIVHLRGQSGRTQPADTARAYRQSHVRFYEKHHPGWAPLLKVYLRLRGHWPANS